jgi:hypothetical protein
MLLRQKHADTIDDCNKQIEAIEDLDEEASYYANRSCKLTNQYFSTISRVQKTLRLPRVPCDAQTPEGREEYVLASIEAVEDVITADRDAMAFQRQRAEKAEKQRVELNGEMQAQEERRDRAMAKYPKLLREMYDEFCNEMRGRKQGHDGPGVRNEAGKAGRLEDRDSGEPTIDGDQPSQPALTTATDKAIATSSSASRSRLMSSSLPHTTSSSATCVAPPTPSFGGPLSYGTTHANKCNSNTTHAVACTATTTESTTLEPGEIVEPDFEHSADS